MIDVALERIRALIDLGGPVVAILLAASVLALAVALWKLVVFEIEGIGRATARGFLERTLINARAARARGIDDATLRERVLARLEDEFGRVSAGLRILDQISQIAPLLGLFGTVLGMIDAFRTLQAAGSSADPGVLAGGIWVALMTTAAGLVVAIPASLLLAWFDARLAAHRRHGEEALEEVLNPGLLNEFSLPARRDVHARV